MTSQVPADLARFRACLPLVLAQECLYPDDWSNPRNFSDAAHDPGGATMCGITEREYAVYRKARGLPAQDVRRITAAEGEDIYDGSYWLPDCPTLPAGLDLCVFDANVNQGPVQGTRILQFALDMKIDDVDGAWGPRTDAAVKAIKDVPAAIEAFTARRRQVYRATRGFHYFGAGWLRRATAIGAAALKMAAAVRPSA